MDILFYLLSAVIMLASTISVLFPVFDTITGWATYFRNPACFLEAKRRIQAATETKQIGKSTYYYSMTGNVVVLPALGRWISPYHAVAIIQDGTLFHVPRGHKLYWYFRNHLN